LGHGHCANGTGCGRATACKAFRGFTWR
jgi:hypothetical protein